MADYASFHVQGSHIPNRTHLFADRQLTPPEAAFVRNMYTAAEQILAGHIPMQTGLPTSCGFTAAYTQLFMTPFNLSGKPTINICPRWWFKKKRGRALVLLHESLHIVFGRNYGVEDEHPMGTLRDPTDYQIYVDIHYPGARTAL